MFLTKHITIKFSKFCSMVLQECWKNVLFLNLFWLCLLDSLSYMLLEQSVLCYWECYWHLWFITDFMIHNLTVERFKQKNWDLLRRAASLQRQPQDLGKHGDSEKDRLVSTVHRWVSWTGYKDGHYGHRRKTLARSNVQDGPTEWVISLVFWSQCLI